MDADVPFNEVETGISEESTDRIGSDIETVDLVIVVFQQPLGQMVTDKPVHAED